MSTLSQRVAALERQLAGDTDDQMLPPSIHKRLERIEDELPGLRKGQRACFARLGELQAELDAIAAGESCLDEMLHQLAAISARRPRRPRRREPGTTSADLGRLMGILERSIAKRP